MRWIKECRHCGKEFVNIACNFCSQNCVDEICERYRSDKKRYDGGIKRCTSCDAFLHYQGIQCPCCGTKLRPKRKAKFR